MRLRSFGAYGYEPGGSSPHAAFCDQLNVAMAELNVSLEKAYALGLASNTTVVQAAYLFDQNNDFWTRKWLTVPLTNQCDTMSAEVRAAVTRVNSLLGAEAPAPLRPDYVPTDPFSLSWLPWVAGIGLVAYLFGPGIRGLQSRKFAGYAHKRRR